jgi:hypothetical protein
LTVPVDQAANTVQNYTTNIGTLNATGKLYLNAELENSLGQTIATSEYPLYIIDDDTLLLLSTDKKVYRPGEPVKITGEVRNLTSITASAITLNLSANNQNLYTESLDLPANGNYPFTITTIASAEGVYALSGKVTQNNSTLVEIVDQYEVSSPKVTAIVSAPDVCGSDPFDIYLEIKNKAKTVVDIQFLAMSDQQTLDHQRLTIPAGETKLIRYSQQITGDTTYTFTFIGDVEQTIQQTVVFGEKADIQIDIQPLYKEGSVTILYTVKNIGFWEANYPVTVTLLKDGQELSRTTESFTLPIGGNSSSTISYNLNEGLYTFRYETTGFQAESQINVVKPGQGDISLTLNETYPEGAISIPYTITNTGQCETDYTVEFSLNSSIISRNAFVAARGLIRMQFNIR